MWRLVHATVRMILVFTQFLSSSCTERDACCSKGVIPCIDLLLSCPKAGIPSAFVDQDFFCHRFSRILYALPTNLSLSSEHCPCIMVMTRHSAEQLLFSKSHLPLLWHPVLALNCCHRRFSRLLQSCLQHQNLQCQRCTRAMLP